MLAHPQFAGRVRDGYGKRFHFGGFAFARVTLHKHAVGDHVQALCSIGNVLRDGYGFARRWWHVRRHASALGARGHAASP
jgi:hypothetical protein